MALPNGHVMDVAGLPGRWQVWTQSGNSPGAYFLVPFDELALTADLKWAEVRLVYKRTSAIPTSTILHRERKGHR